MNDILIIYTTFAIILNEGFGTTFDTIYHYDCLIIYIISTFSACRLRRK